MMRYHYTHSSMAKIKKIHLIKRLQGCGLTRISMLCWWERKMMPPLWKRVWQFFFLSLANSLKFHIHFTCDSTIPPLREMITYVHPKTCMQMFIVALFIIVPNWEQCKCASNGKSVKNGGTSLQWHTAEQFKGVNC